MKNIEYMVMRIEEIEQKKKGCCRGCQRRTITPKLNIHDWIISSHVYFFCCKGIIKSIRKYKDMARKINAISRSISKKVGKISVRNPWNTIKGTMNCWQTPRNFFHPRR
ncbi:hypothetical protein RCO48_26165 [Peribacillus frigoritolerans]|nr:hypothetical protein [Peribacillus frigoritolerans]